MFRVPRIQTLELHGEGLRADLALELPCVLALPTVSGNTTTKMVAV
jgi:hypothetical protein